MRGMMRHRKIWSLPLFAMLLTLAFIGCDLNDPDEPGNLVPMTVDEDTALPSIFVNGTQLHAEAFGDIHSPIIVFLHGGTGSDYRAFISQIGRENASRYPEERSYTGGGLSQLQDEYEKIYLSHIEHTEFYRKTYYEDAKDGWYKFPGGMFQFGIEGGATIKGKYDIHLEVKMPFTEAFNSYEGSPSHVNLGFGYRF